jgi:hypothetical protein
LESLLDATLRMTPEFDIRALFGALDEQRQVRGMSWAQVAREMSNGFRLARAPAISVSTLTGIATKRVVEGDGVLQMLLWLKRSPESFLRGSGGKSRDAELLPDVGPACILRFDACAIYAALDAMRIARGESWQQVANEIGGTTVSGLTRLARGGRVSFPDVMRIVGWLGRAATTYTRAAAM